MAVTTKTNQSATVVLVDTSLDREVDAFRLDGYQEGFRIWPTLSPDGNHIAVFVSEEKRGYGRALFVVPTGQ